MDPHYETSRHFRPSGTATTRGAPWAQWHRRANTDTVPLCYAPPSPAISGSSSRGGLEPGKELRSEGITPDILQHFDTIDQCPFCRNVFCDALELAKHFAGHCPKAHKIILASAADLYKMFQRRSRRHAKHQRKSLTATPLFRASGQGDSLNRESKLGSEPPIPLPSSGRLHKCGQRCPCKCARSNSVSSFCPRTSLDGKSHPASTRCSPAISRPLSALDSAICQELTKSNSSPFPGGIHPGSTHPLNGRRFSAWATGKTSLPTLAQVMSEPGRVFQHPAVNHPGILRQAARVPVRPLPVSLPHPAQIPSAAERNAEALSGSVVGKGELCTHMRNDIIELFPIHNIGSCLRVSSSLRHAFSNKLLQQRESKLGGTYRNVHCYQK